jgi:protein Mpv17
VSAVLIAAAGDIVCQKMQGRHGHTIDWPRTGRMAAITGIVTPGVHYWYTFLIHKFPTHALKRMLADQVVWAPAGVVVFLLGIGLMETGSFDSGIVKIRESFVQVMLMNWTVWPVVQYFNFKYIPAQYQVLAVNIVSFFWSMYISKMANKPHPSLALGEASLSGIPATHTLRHARQAVDAIPPKQLQ